MACAAFLVRSALLLSRCSCLVQGQVLNLTSAWWMQNTQHLMPNALLDVPHPNVSIMRHCKVFPVEVVVRGFMTGAWP